MKIKNRARSFKINLTTKLISCVLIGVAAILLASKTASIRTEQKLLANQISAMGDALTNSIGVALVEPMLLEDYPVLQSITDLMVKEQNEILFIKVFRIDGKQITSSFRDPQYNTTDGFNSDELTIHAAPIAVEKGTEDMTKIGDVKLGVSNIKATAIIDDRTQSMLMEGIFLFLGLIILLTYILRTVILRPIKELDQHATQLMLGDLDNEVRLKRSDEFGHLSETLDQMRIRLKDNHDTLVRKNSALKSLDQLKDNFISNMSHELQTPMNGIVGVVDLLMETDLTYQQQKHLDTIQSSSRSLMSLISDLLHYSELEKGSFELEAIDFSLSELIQELSLPLEDLANEKQLIFRTSTDENIPTHLKGDPGRIRQLLSKLAHNSLKFTEKGFIHLHCELVKTANRRYLIKFTMTDSGVGIPEEQQQEIFNKFSQADSSMTRAHGGVGLGLTICKELIGLMDGEIGFESVLGKGSTFWFKLWMDESKYKPEVPSQVAPPTNDLNVLCVIHDSKCKTAVDEMLKSWNIDYSFLDNIESTLTTLLTATEKNSFDIAIIDSDFQTKTALDLNSLATSIKENASINQTKLIMLTTGSAYGDLSSAIRSGFSAYLLKPIRKSDLQDSITLLSKQIQLIKQDNGDTEGLSDTPTHITKERRSPSEVTILLVDDNSINLMVAKGILKKLGVHIVCAEHGAEALEKLKHHAIDIVIMDIQMPVMDGIEATRAIRNETSGLFDPNIPILSLSANSLPEDIKQYKEAGFNDCISKPVTMDGFKTYLKHWVVLN